MHTDEDILLAIRTEEQQLKAAVLRGIRGEHIVAVFTDYHTMYRMMHPYGRHGVYLMANQILKFPSGGWVQGIVARSEPERLCGIMADVVYIGRSMIMTTNAFRCVAQERSMRYALRYKSNVKADD